MPRNDCGYTAEDYKLFEQDMRTGKLYPLFIGKGKEVPTGVWLEAESIPTKGYALRPGWHIGAELPDAPWLKGYDPAHPEGVYKSKRGKSFRRVWCLVTYPTAINYQTELDERGIRDIKDHVPEGGYYTFREANGLWIIAGAVRIDKVLTEAERKEILSSAGYDEEEAWKTSKDYQARKRQYERRHAC